jgi:polyhydroxyalkanoate synthesis repressor PhaR
MTGVARMPRVIKRYQNRKLYDTEARRYVSLERVERLIREGVEITVVDAATGADLTPVILTEILLTRERKGQAALPSLFLHQLIKYGGAWEEFLSRGFQATVEGVVASQREGERLFREWAARTGLTQPRIRQPRRTGRSRGRGT